MGKSNGFAVTTDGESGLTMNAQDIIKISRNAKRETETFINRYFDDQAKGWPRVCLAGSVCTGGSQDRQIEASLSGSQVQDWPDRSVA